MTISFDACFHKGNTDSPSRKLMRKPKMSRFWTRSRQDPLKEGISKYSKVKMTAGILPSLNGDNESEEK